MNFVGLDIGGANLKFASTNVEKREIPFAMWQHKDRLSEALGQFHELVGPNDRVGVTMTAELADCFESKQAGVKFIVQSVVEVFNKPEQSPLFYRTDGTMCDSNKAIEDWKMVAASNWHALAWLAFLDPKLESQGNTGANSTAVSKEKSGFVFDIGSTTTDIIPVRDGIPVISSQTDLMRLQNGQLYYGGVGRTPICSLLHEVWLDEKRTGIAREFFATINDAFIVLNELPVDDNCFDTADGRSRSYQDAQRRLSRMVCADSQADAAYHVAGQARKCLMDGITQSLLKVTYQHNDLPPNFVTFGGGAWLANKIIESQKENFFSNPTHRSFSHDRLTNQTAPAFAVAKKREQVFGETGK